MKIGIALATAAFGLLLGGMPASAQGLAHELYVRTCASPALGSVNTHIVMTDAGLVLIDAQRVSSQAAIVAEIVSGYKLPVLAIVITHAHPDHFGGLAELHRAFPRAVIVASAATAHAIETDAGQYIAKTAAFLGTDFGAVVPAPSLLVADHESLEFGGETFRFDEIGQGEAEAMTVVVMPRRHILFASDLVGNGVTPFLLEGHTSGWQEQLAKAENDYADIERIYPGHGPSQGGTGLFSEQARYLQTFRQTVTDHATGGSLTPAARAIIVARINQLYPDRNPVMPAPNLVSLNADAVAKELGAESLKKEHGPAPRR